MLSASEKLVVGGLRKGGGKGRGARLAKRETPVEKQKGPRGRGGVVVAGEVFGGVVGGGELFDGGVFGGGEADGEVKLRASFAARNRSVSRTKREGRARARGRSERDDRRIPGFCLGLMRGNGSWSLADVDVVRGVVGRRVGGSGFTEGWLIRSSWGLANLSRDRT